jgi:hypothetical protein
MCRHAVLVDRYQGFGRRFCPYVQSRDTEDGIIFSGVITMFATLRTSNLKIAFSLVYKPLIQGCCFLALFVVQKRCSNIWAYTAFS